MPTTQFDKVVFAVKRAEESTQWWQLDGDASWLKVRPNNSITEEIKRILFVICTFKLSNFSVKKPSLYEN
jgi:hypothetical protein